MESFEQLYIRACRSKNPSKRLVTLHKRLYLPQGVTQTENNIICDLANIVDKYNPFTNYNLILAIKSEKLNDTMLEIERTDNERLIYILYSRIRFTKATNFEGLSTPRRFK